MPEALCKLTDFDLHLHRQGTDLRVYDKLGAHILPGGKGVRFALWAPNAQFVSVVGDFNGWDRSRNPLTTRASSGVWEGIVPEAGQGDRYKFFLESNKTEYSGEKADPYAFCGELRPKTASIVWDLAGYQWGDQAYLQQRERRNILAEPFLTYELHLGSWRRTLDNQWLSYRDLADQLPGYIEQMGFTHIEFLPVFEHPFDGSWGYQTTSYFAPTSRFGTPQDFMYLIDTLHQRGIGVILDWTPAHFPTDAHGLSFFDGTHLYEHADPKKGRHPDWDTLIFQYGRHEVKNFLIGSALFWLEKYHIDGLRVDAVASMLYLDYSRSAGEWIPNEYGGRENLEALSFIRTLNETVYREHPSCVVIAEESTAWPMVSRPTSVGGLGFGFKWNMGWMNDTLQYISRDPVHRSHHHGDLTFSLLYAFHENFILPISHDEVVHGKRSVLSKMPGDIGLKFAGVRLLYGYMYGHPGKKLLFMGQEFGQWDEWSHDRSIDWHLLQYRDHVGLSHWVRDLNALLRQEPALFECDASPTGFEWVDCNDSSQSILTFLRFSTDRRECLLVVCNFAPVARRAYRIGVPYPGTWREMLNSDSHIYGGANEGNCGVAAAQDVHYHGRPYSVELCVPGLSALFLKPE